jgi:hypothetical protein
LTVSSLSFACVMTRGVRDVSAQPIYLIAGLMYAQCHAVSTEIHVKRIS